jgi:dUTP pyrophosphatase
MDINYTNTGDKYTEPTFGSEFAAGADLYSITGYTIMPGETVKVDTEIAVEIPEGYFGAIFARSGLATKKGLRPANCVGVIDSDYRGPILVAIHNDSDKV